MTTTRKIKDYKILRAYSTGEYTVAMMNEEIKNLVDSGWEHAGEPKVAGSGDKPSFMVIQAMVKYATY